MEGILHERDQIMLFYPQNTEPERLSVQIYVHIEVSIIAKYGNIWLDFPPQFSPKLSNISVLWKFKLEQYPQAKYL